MSTRARIATVCQSRRYYSSVAENLAYVMGRLELALAQKTDLVCLPETFVTASVPGFIADLAEPVPGPTIDAIARLARQHGSYIICPLLTQRDGRFHNSAVVIGRKGEIMGIYDKVHGVTTTPDYTQLEHGATPGLQVPVFDLDFGRVGIQICFDLVFSEGWVQLEQQGAQLVLWPSAYNGGMPLQMYAALHHYYVVSSVSQDKSRIIDPCGTVLSETNWPVDVIWRDINLDNVVCHTDFNGGIPDRITAAYPGQVEIRPHFDAGMFLVEPINPAITIAQLQREFGFESWAQYQQRHQLSYDLLRDGKPLPSQQAAHGNRPMYSKQ